MESEVRKVFASGITIPIEYRKSLLQKLKSEILKLEPEIMKALHDDLGKCEWEARSSEIGVIVSEINHTIEHMFDWASPKYFDSPAAAMPASARVVPSPIGTVLIISPWNYPLNLALVPLVSAIAAGNTVVIKPSELAPHTSKIICKIISNSFVKGEALVVEGGVDIVTELLKQPFDHVFFTGSTRVGKIVARAAAETLAGCTLELGGKSPCIVDQSVNIFQTARKIAWGKTFNAGQTCVAPDYMLVHTSIHDELVQAIKEQWQAFYGPKAEDSPDYGRIINEQQFDRLVKFFDPSSSTIHGGKYNRSAKFIEPTILTNISMDHPIMAEEIFGPILPVLKWSTSAELDHLLSKHQHPLAFYVFSKNKKFSEELIIRHSFGGGCVNHIAHHLGSPDLPFGGIRSSGIGQYHGKFGFDTFTHLKGIVDAHASIDFGLKYPPYKSRAKWLKWLYR